MSIQVCYLRVGSSPSGITHNCSSNNCNRRCLIGRLCIREDVQVSRKEALKGTTGTPAEMVSPGPRVTRQAALEMPGTKGLTVVLSNKFRKGTK